MLRKIIIFALLIGVTLALVLVVAPSRSQPAKAQAGTVVYNLYATDGYVTMADGVKSYIYGFIGGRQGTTISYLDKNGALLSAALPDPTGGVIQPAELPLAGNAQFPAPVIYASTGDVVEIRLKNLGVSVASAPNDPHTIHLHGLDVDAANDGVPETSVAAVPANAKKTPGAGNVVVYMFSPTAPGTYMYHCHQEASIHVQMGMYGALVVYNPGDAAAATGPGSGAGGSLHGWEYDKDYILLLSEFDMGQHQAEEKGGPFNPVAFQPQYWFVNGLSFPNTIHAGLGFNWNNWIAAHPGYDPFIQGSITGGTLGAPGDQVLLRVINMGFQAQPMHMHGYHGKIIGSDQRAWDWANAPGTPNGVGLEKNTLLIGSGETYEWLVDFSEQQQYSTYANGTGGVNGTFPGGTQTRYTLLNNQPASNTSANPAIPDPFMPPFTYIGGPTVGPIAGQNDNPELLAIVPANQGQFFPFHNHDDYKATNNGVYPGGMFTMLLTTP
jgi:FtsP/CotA-like multicopper oxidase with cupredoxin domain